MNATLLPDKFLRLMDPADRKSLGKAGRTSEEAIAAADIKAEAELQSQIAQYLRLLSIKYIKPDMRKKSPLPEGWPDFTFAYKPQVPNGHGVPLAIEAKGPVTPVTREQYKCHAELRQSGWNVHIVRSLSEVQAILRGIDAEQADPGKLKVSDLTGGRS